MRPVHLLLFLTVFRLSGVYLVKTWFVPDEVFQSVEVSYRAVFGSGHLTWEWTHSLRSVIHPAAIAVAFHLLRLLSVDTNFSIIIVPKIMHSLLFAVSDFFFYLLAKRILPPHGALYALFSYLSCWFVFYCAPRTLSNSVETALTIIALKWYPLSDSYSSNGRFWPYMAIASIAILIRPTAILLWAPLGLLHIWRCKSPFMLILFTCIPSIVPIILISICIDSLAYRQWTFPAWNFAKFNVFDGGSSHFGVHPWHWYLTQGIATVLTFHLVPIVGGIICALRKRNVNLSLLVISLWYIAFHCFLAHKEHRFILPVIPLTCIYSGFFFLSFRNVRVRKLFMTFLLLVNIPLAAYTGIYHQVAPFSAAEYIASHASSHSLSRFAILQLMPCYSMPQYSYFHGFNVSIRALDCSPNLSNSSSYVDEADMFHSNPVSWISSNTALLSLASYVVLYEKTFRLLQKPISDEGFDVCARLFHAHFLSSSRQDNYMVVACKL